MTRYKDEDLAEIYAEKSVSEVYFPCDFLVKCFGIDIWIRPDFNQKGISQREITPADPMFTYDTKTISLSRRTVELLFHGKRKIGTIELIESVQRERRENKINRLVDGLYHAIYKKEPDSFGVKEEIWKTLKNMSDNEKIAWLEKKLSHYPKLLSRYTNTHNTRAMQKAMEGVTKECCVCKTEKYLQIHHIDSNPENNEPGNLMYLCTKHHGDTRKDWFKKRFWLSLIGTRKAGKERVVSIIKNHR